MHCLVDQIRPGMTVEVVQQVPFADAAWTGRVRGTVLDYRQEKTGSWYAHARDEKLWLDRLTLRTDDGEIVELSLDTYSHIDILRS